MKTPATIVLLAAVALTATALGAWWITDRHYYTKYEVVEQVEVALDADDPLVLAGFYDERARVETVRRREFHLGLLPVPQGVFDKHALSVLTLVAPAWLLCLPLAWWLRHRRDRRGNAFPAAGA